MGELAECPYRSGPESQGGTPSYACGLARQILGLTADGACRVTHDTCAACCKTIDGFNSLNPVIASVVFSTASRIVRNGGEAGCSKERAVRVRDQVHSHLGVVLATVPERVFPPAAPAGVLDVERREARVLQWAVGVLTAPRAKPTLEPTLASLQRAELFPDAVFAEPGSLLPEQLSGSQVVLHDRPLGNFRNFYYALVYLLEHSPNADCYAIFQDDVHVAENLRGWCDAQFWPLEAGIVSLFTPRAHAAKTQGWNLRFPGFHRVFGGQALVFRRDLLEAFLADPHVFGGLDRRTMFDDGIVSAWATRHRLGIAYHTPSLVAHTGSVSSIFVEGPDRRVCADAVRSTTELKSWQPPRAEAPKIALIGYNAPTGTGYQNRELARQLGVDRWIIVDCPYAPLLDPPEVPCHLVSQNISNGELSALLKGADWLLFSEQPYLPNVLSVTGRLGISVACLPNWEIMVPEWQWLASVDLMICPTRHTYTHVYDWKQRYNFGWDVICAPWPVDATRYPFRLRERCREFVFIAGYKGTGALDINGHPKGYNRKGYEVVLEAARIAPHLPFIFYSQLPLDRDTLPPNVELAESPADNTELYCRGDICVQPSHWEGIGLQLLECQAAGMPLITTAAPPMNECNPLATIPVERQELVAMRGGMLAMSNLMSPGDLVRELERFHGADISEASRAARSYIEEERSWTRARETILPHLVRHRL